MARKKQAAVRNRRWKSTSKKHQLQEARKKIGKKKSNPEHEVTEARDGAFPTRPVSAIDQPVPSTSTAHADFSTENQFMGASAKKFKAFHGKTDRIVAARSREQPEAEEDRSSDCLMSDEQQQREQEGEATSLPTTICDLGEVANLFAACACPECFQCTLKLCADEQQSRGMAVCLKVQCTNCRAIISTGHTSRTLPGDNNCFEVNRKTVLSSMMCGFGSKKLNKFCEYVNIPGLSGRTFHKHCDRLYELVPEVKEQLLELAAQTVREAHKEINPDLQDTDVLDIAVSFDGSWLTRGHSSLIGIACAIDLLTGICVDFHVMSKYCQKCATTGEKMKQIGPQAHLEWYDRHRDSCQKNFDGSSGMMEVEGAKVLWGRSLTKKMRYTTILSDGDCKSYLELCKLNPYGDNCPIEKAECINHVSKRLGTALRTAVSDNKKRGVSLGGRGEGTLTQATITKLQSYYTKAIRSTTQSPQAMEDAVWASVFHCVSTDEDPHHHRCPKDENSWCFYNRALARHEIPPQHEGNLGTALNRNVFNYIVPVYKRLADKDLLKRCMQSKTQNANESLHSVIWSRCPKETFASRSKVELATLIAVGEFNMGSTASHNFMVAQGLTVGQDTLRLGNLRDSVRKKNSQRSKEIKQQQRREKVRQAKQKERRQQIEAEGGPAYVPGGF